MLLQYESVNREGGGGKRKGENCLKKNCSGMEVSLWLFFNHVLPILFLNLMGSGHCRQDLASGLGRKSTRGHHLHDSPTSNALCVE